MALRALSWLTPELTARWAERQFLTPRRHARPEAEQTWLERAERGQLRYRVLEDSLSSIVDFADALRTVVHGSVRSKR